MRIGVWEGPGTLQIPHGHLQQVVCMDMISDLAMHGIQQVHRDGS